MPAELIALGYRWCQEPRPLPFGLAAANLIWAEQLRLMRR